MLTTEFFLVRPKNRLSSLLAEIGEEPSSEFGTPVVWSQRFDLRITGRPNADDLIKGAVKLKYLAYAASQLGVAFFGRFKDITPDVFDDLWTIEWIKGGMVEEAEIYGELTDEVVSRISLGSLVNHEELATALSESIEKMRLRAKAEAEKLPRTVFGE